MIEMPSITSSAYVTTGTSGHLLMGMAAPAVGAAQPHSLNALLDISRPGGILRGAAAAFEEDVKLTGFGLNQKESQVGMRFVKIFIVDPTDDLPLAQRVLHNGAEQLTDLTDQELFFELPIKELLDKHNATRAGTLNKKATDKAGKDVFLEPIRVRDLRMNVTLIASF